MVFIQVISFSIFTEAFGDNYFANKNISSEKLESNWILIEFFTNWNKLINSTIYC